MKNIIIIVMLTVIFVVLQSFQSCHSDLIVIDIANRSEDTIYCTIRSKDAYSERDGYMWDVFEGVSSWYEWKRIAPRDTSDVYSCYLDDKESVSWKVWCVKKTDMSGMTLEKIIDNNLLDSLCSMIRVYTYEDLKELNFCIKVY